MPCNNLCHKHQKNLRKMRQRIKKSQRLLLRSPSRIYSKGSFGSSGNVPVALPQKAHCHLTLSRRIVQMNSNPLHHLNREDGSDAVAVESLVCTSLTRNMLGQLGVLGAFIALLIEGKHGNVNSVSSNAMISGKYSFSTTKSDG